MKNTNNITWGLFSCRCRYFYKNLRDIRILFERIIFTLRHGYTPQAQWETFQWFINVMREILINYRYNRMGTAVIIDPYWDKNGNALEDENNVAYDKLLDEMLELLDKMDETNPIYDSENWKENDRMQNEAKDKFFELFSKHFYTFWD